MNDAKLCLRTAELAAALGVSRTTVWRLTQRGELPPPRYVGCSPVWLIDDVKRALARLPTQGSAAPARRRSKPEQPQ
jgi:excisionase family DNA binding protein